MDFHILCLGECTIYAWKECVFWCRRAFHRHLLGPVDLHCCLSLLFAYRSVLLFYPFLKVDYQSFQLLWNFLFLVSILLFFISCVLRCIQVDNSYIIRWIVLFIIIKCPPFCLVPFKIFNLLDLILVKPPQIFMIIVWIRYIFPSFFF